LLRCWLPVLQFARWRKGQTTSLYKALLEPVADMIKGKRLLIVPAGALRPREIEG
jgi:hypothetical protein